MRRRLASYLLAVTVLIGAAIVAPRAWATPGQTRPGQTVPTPTPKGQPTPVSSSPTARPPAEPSPTLAPGAPSPTPDLTPLAPPADAAGLVFTKEVSRQQVWPGATVRYTLTLNNTGASSARQVVLSDALPPELEPGPILAGAAAWDGRTLRAEAVILPPGGQLVVTFAATVRADVTPGRAVVNRATATAAGDASLSAATTVILPPAELPPTGGKCGLQIADF
ncbi:MAG: hypothetical protein NT169_06935 [Chloroflexi bacterium]|nr:hypothetical protein [Chloroflexota bacterium]